ncbi:MAG: AAA family ATPase [Acidilobus sp.]
MTYIIRSVTLRNFLSHENTSIRFPTGSVALVGENGAGKTSVFEAIYYALTGSGWRGKAADLVQLGKQSAIIQLELEDPASGSRAEAEVRIEKRRETASSTYRLKVDGKLVATTASSYKEEIARLLGLQGVTDYRGFVESAIIIRQGGLAEIASILASEESKKLKELVESAIGVPQLERAAEAIRSHTIRAVRGDGSVIMAFDVGPRRRAEVMKAIQAARDLRRAKLEEVKALQAKLSEAERLLSTITMELDSVSKAAEEACKASTVLEALKQEASEAERLLKDESARLSRLRKQADELQARIDALKPIARYASLSSLVNELSDLNSKAAAIAERIGSLKPVADAYLEFTSTSEQHRAYEEARRRLDELRAKRSALAEELRAVEALTSQAERVEDSIRRALDEARRLLGAEPSCDEQCLGSMVSGLDKEVEDLRRRAQELGARAEASERRLRELQDVLRLLRAGGKEARCPVCGSPLTAERVQELVAHYEEERSRLESELRSVKDELKAVSERANALTDSLNKARALLSSVAQLRSSAQDLMNLRQRREALARSLGSLDEEVSELERRVKELEAYNARYVAALSALESRGYKPPEKAVEAARELEALQAELEKVKSRAKELEDRLLKETGSRTAQEAIAKVKDAVNASAQLKALEESLKTITSQALDSESRVRELELKLTNIRSRLSELEPKAKECASLREREKELRSKKDAAINEVASLRSRLEQTKVEAMRAGEDEAALSKALDKLDAALGALEAIERLEKALYRRALVSLENEMNEVFKLFGLDYSRIEVHETGDSFYFRVVDRQGVERPISTLSGGEQIVVSLAYVLALSRIMQSRVGFLLLDEPTDMLDDERRRALVDILGRLTEEGGLPQLIVITHHLDVIDKVDKVCNVEKDQQGVSHVNCGEGVTA